MTNISLFVQILVVEFASSKKSENIGEVPQNIKENTEISDVTKNTSVS